jgi:hypothetical protein
MPQVSDADLDGKLALAERELREALERQAATDEVLRVIASSTGELDPVFETILANATRICEAKFGNLWLRDGDSFRIAVMHNPPPALAEARQREPLVQPPPDTSLGRPSGRSRAECRARSSPRRETSTAPAIQRTLTKRRRLRTDGARSYLAAAPCA